MFRMFLIFWPKSKFSSLKLLRQGSLWNLYRNLIDLTMKMKTKVRWELSTIFLKEKLFKILLLLIRKPSISFYNKTRQIIKKCHSLVSHLHLLTFISNVRNYATLEKNNLSNKMWNFLFFLKLNYILHSLTNVFTPFWGNCFSFCEINKQKQKIQLLPIEISVFHPKCFLNVQQHFGCSKLHSLKSTLVI